MNAIATHLEVRCYTPGNKPIEIAGDQNGIGEPAGTRTQDHLIKSRVGYVVTSDREASLDRKFS
jgi:hypothetical protein